jgi:hypothetical protein
VVKEGRAQLEEQMALERSERRTAAQIAGPNPQQG